MSCEPRRWGVGGCVGYGPRGIVLYVGWACGSCVLSERGVRMVCVVCGFDSVKGGCPLRPCLGCCLAVTISSVWRRRLLLSEPHSTGSLPISLDLQIGKPEKWIVTHTCPSSPYTKLLE